MNMTYEEFINNILEIRGRFACGDEYHERHHIIPKCMGGTNAEDNLIDLFAREHFEAHRLLALENPENKKLTYAWWMMSNMNKTNQRNFNIDAKEYEEARKKFCTTSMTEETRKKIGVKAKIRLSDPKNCPTFGKHLSAETKKKIGMASRKRRHSLETRRKISELQKGKKRGPRTEETKQKIREKVTGYKHTEDARKKMSNAKTGRSNGQEKPIFCVELNAIFRSFKEAEEKMDIYHGNISKVCNEKGLKTTGGYHWKYIYDQTHKDGTTIPGAISLGLIAEEDALKQLEEKNNKGEE